MSCAPVAQQPLTPAGRCEFLRYTRTEQWPMLVRFPVADQVHLDLLARMIGAGAADVRSMISDMAAVAHDAAAELMADWAYSAGVAALPASAGDRIVAVGDSVTADRMGWLDILAQSLHIAGRDELRLDNLGLSGSTTADALERFDLIQAARPTRVLLMLGTNDARTHGLGRRHQMATGSESERNLAAIAELIEHQLHASVTLITPPLADPRRTATMPDNLGWDGAAVADVARAVRKLDPACIDVYEAMQDRDVDVLLEADGIHPSLAGQKLIARTVVDSLVRLWSTP